MQMMTEPKNMSPSVGGWGGGDTITPNMSINSMNMDELIYHFSSVETKH